ncbi:MAG TPA: replicative DNA helicase [Candidatus Eremiobacteraceae bacterium]|nr:replicative DNA helicase [Candidatus Eremiobacteraceae bacterium]
MAATLTAIDRIPPQNLDAEQAVLGALMVDRELMPVVAEIVVTADFYAPHHATIYDALHSLYERGEPIDKVSVAEELRRRKVLDEVGGLDLLTQLLDAVPTTASVEYYAKIVAEKALLRSLITAGSRISVMGFEPTEDVDQTLDQCEQMIFDIGRRQTAGFTLVKDLLKPTFEQIDKLYHQSGNITGIPSGFASLDHYTAGWQQGELIVVGARPSMGKTAFALGAAAYAARTAGKTVAIFSLEMSDHQIVQRLLSADARIDAQKLRTGNMQDEDWGKITQAMGRLAEMSIYVDDAPALSTSEVRSRSRRLQSRSGLDLIIVDYLQLMRSTNPRVMSRVEIIDEICRGLKALAKELRVPVIALAQLNRSLEVRTDKRPMLSDLRESGGIEQEADVVAFIYRDEYYNPGSDQENLAEIIIAKQRNGPTGMVKLRFDKKFTSFSDLDLEHSEL